MGKTTSRTTSRVCLQTKSSHTAIGQFCIRIICRSCTINVVRSPSTGPFGVNLNCLRINTEILKCPIPLWTDLDELYTPDLFELGFAEQRTRDATSRLGLLVLLKTFQRLGYSANTCRFTAGTFR